MPTPWRNKQSVDGMAPDAWPRRHHLGKHEISLTEIAVIRRRLKGEPFRQIGAALDMTESGARQCVQAVRRRLGLASTVDVLQDARVLEAIKESAGE